jgi:transposase
MTGDDKRLLTNSCESRNEQSDHLYNQRCLIQAFGKGNSDSTLAFLTYLLEQYPDRQIALIWDRASYHRSQAVKDYLQSVNQGLDESAWRITCIRFAPNDPTQNPIEDVWLQAKRLIRESYHLCKSFDAVKFLFEFVTHRQIFEGIVLVTLSCFVSQAESMASFYHAS